MLKLALAQYPVSAPACFDDAAHSLSQWVADAAAQDSQLLVFPEYAALCLAATLSPALQANLHGQLAALQALLPDYYQLHRSLAQRHSVYVLAGSFPVALPDGRYVNRAYLFAPNGKVGFQDKQIMTRFEREAWGISGNPGLKVFDTALGSLAIHTCYDIEFPLLARASALAGAQLLLVPSCTDTHAGYWRVRIGAQARALENQCLVAQAPLVGYAEWSPAIDHNVGAAGLYAPPDYGWPEDGVVSAGQWNTPGWVYASADLAAVNKVRTEGQVLNHRDWLHGGDMPPVERVSLL